MVEELKSMVGPDETILYEGKPDKKCFIIESVFNPLLPIAIIWAIFDLGFIGGYQVFKRWELVAQKRPKPRKPVVYNFSIKDLEKKYKVSKELFKK